MRGIFRRPCIDLFPDDGSKSPPSDPGSAERISSLPDLIEFNAKYNAPNLFAVQARSGQEDLLITFEGLKHAVDGCSTWLSTLKREKTDAPVALLLESDVLLFVHIAALLQLNVPCLLLSLRLSDAAINHLLTSTGAEYAITSQRTASRIDALGKTSFTTPSLTHFLELPSSYAGKPQSDRKATRTSNTLGSIILHSSGTTGLPKPIRLGQRYVVGYAACHTIPEAEMSNRKLNLSTLPLYHGFGLLAPCLSLSIGMTVLMMPSSTIPNGTLLYSMLCEKDVTSLMTVPSVLEDLVELTQTDAIQRLTLVDFVAVGGGAMRESLGSLLSSRGVPVLNHFGATEIGALAPIFNVKNDPEYEWRWLRLRNDLRLQLETLERDSDGLENCKLIAHPFDWSMSFELQDRLVRNPKSKHQEVRILGRKDDMIVLGTGEKIMPSAWESALSQIEAVKSALLFGEGKFQLGVLLEPSGRWQHRPSKEFIDEIWPEILHLNELADAHARITSKVACLVKPRDKDIPRSDKGAIQRRETYTVFEQEINETFEALENDDSGVPALRSDDSDLSSRVRQLVRQVIASKAVDDSWNDDADLIELGLDSLQIMKLQKMLNAGYKKTSSTNGTLTLPRDFVYARPSVRAISDSLRLGDFFTAKSASRENSILSALQNYLGQPNDSETAHERKQENVVLLTGSTGSLGAHILFEILQTTSVASVICFVRYRTPSRKQSDGINDALWSAQRQAMSSRGLHLRPDQWARVKPYRWTPGQLDDATKRALIQKVTHIFHGAWPMHFQLKLRSFDQHLKALLDLMDVAKAIGDSRPDCRPRFIFASSIAVVGQYTSKTGCVPETIIEDPNVTLPMGYAEAKWVCEKLVQEFSEQQKNCVEASIMRIGQLSGSETAGYWSPSEHFPRLLQVSQKLGHLPQLSGKASWMPVDRAAKVTRDVLLQENAPWQLVYHLENPVGQPWSQLVQMIRGFPGLGTLDELPFEEWLEHACKVDQSLDDLRFFLRDHFRRMSDGSLTLQTRNTLAASPTLRTSGAVPMNVIQKYVASWQADGLISKTAVN